MMNDLTDADWSLNYNIVHAASFSNFVFVNAMVAAPVIHVDHWVAIHGWRMATAATNNLVSFRFYWRVSKLRDKPDAGRTLHA
jgi:hypothetical protein